VPPCAPYLDEAGPDLGTAERLNASVLVHVVYWALTDATYERLSELPGAGGWARVSVPNMAKRLFFPPPPPPPPPPFFKPVLFFFCLNWFSPFFFFRSWGSEQTLRNFACFTHPQKNCPNFLFSSKKNEGPGRPAGDDGYRTSIIKQHRRVPPLNYALPSSAAAGTKPRLPPPGRWESKKPRAWKPGCMFAASGSRRKS